MNQHNQAHRAVIFTDSDSFRDAAERHKGYRELKGKARTSKGVVQGYRFPDGSALTVQEDGRGVEFLGTFASERTAEERAEVEEVAAVETLPRGAFVKRKANANKVYQRGGYDRSTGKYSLVDCEDVNREVWVRKGTKLHVGFTY